MMLRNILSNWMGLIVTGVISFVLTPILIHGLGDFYYGMWVLVMSVLDYYGLLDLGIRTTLHRYVGRLKGRNDQEALDETVGTTLAITCGVGLLVVVLTVPTIFLLPKFFIVHGAARTLLQRLVLLLGLSLAVLFPARVLGAYLCGLQRFDLYNFGVIATAIARAVSIIVVLRLGFGIVAVGIVTLAIAVLTLLLNWRLLRFADTTVSLDPRRTNWQRIRELASFSFYAFLNTMGDYLRFYTDSAVIGRMLSIALVTPFSVAGRLMSYFKEVVLGLCGPQMPRMSELDGQGKHSELRQLFLQGTKVTSAFSLIIAGLLVVNGENLLRLWLGKDYVQIYPLLIVLTLGYVAALSQYPSRNLLYAKGRHRPFGWWTLGEGAANLLLSIYWARRYGLMGVAVGTTLPMLVVGLLIQPWYALRLIRMSLREYAREALLRPLIACAVFFAICWVALDWQAPVNTARFLVGLVWQGAVLGLLFYSIVLTRPERQIALQRSRHLSGMVMRFSRTELR